MSTQDAKGIPFSVCSDSESFRLFELPPAIAELVSSPNPPQLSIKSAGTSPAASTSPPAYAVLCTPDQTFQLRQVQTSNSLFVTRPVEIQHTTQDDNLGMPTYGISAFASCTASIELHALSESAIPALRRALPLYYIGQDLDISPRATRTEVYEDIPFSNGECDHAWRELVAFNTDGHCFRPAPAALLKVWRSIVTVTAAEDIDIRGNFSIAATISALSDEGFPVELVQSLLLSLTAEESSKNTKGITLDKTRTIRFVGKAVLETEARNSPGILTAVFLDTWRDSLLEAWRADAKLMLIKDMYDLPTSSTIAFKDPWPEVEASGADASSTGSATGRKWHDRFKKTRK